MIQQLIGRVMASSDDAIRVRIDGARGWDDSDREARLPLPHGAKRPPVGAHVTIAVEWEGSDW